MEAETKLDRLHVADTKLQELSFQWAHNLVTAIATVEIDTCICSTAYAVIMLACLWLF